jgi:hypothetical protein
MAPKSNIPHTGIVADVWICVCVCVCAFVRASKINAGTAEQDREDLSVVSLCVPDLQPLVSAPLRSVSHGVFIWSSPKKRLQVRETGTVGTSRS